MKKILVSFMAGFSMLLLINLANADTIPGLFNTGIDSNGNPSTVGTNDLHYLVNNLSAFVVNADNAWLDPLDSFSKWISVSNNTLASKGEYTYTINFDLTGYDYNTAIIEGQLMSDDQVDVTINDTLIVENLGGFTSWKPFSITTGFKSGINTLKFNVTNTYGLGISQTGLRVEFLSSTISPLQLSTVFEDNFDGIALNSSKWNTDHATSGARWCGGLSWGDPGTWIDAKIDSCEGTPETLPYGTVMLDSGLASFSSGLKRAFPYICSGPSNEPSPFPSTENFIFEIRMKYNSIAAHGDGIFANLWEDTMPTGDNSPLLNGIYSIWADSANGLRTSILGQKTYIFNPLNFHTYRLEFIDAKYSLFVDGVKKIDSIDSSLRPTAIWIGNPIFTHWGVSDWSDFTIDYVRVTIPGLKVPENYEFSLNEFSQETFLIHIVNQDTISHSPSLEVLNPHNELIASLGQNTINIASGEIKEIPLMLNALSVSAGTYDMQVKITDDEGNIIYSNIKIYVAADGNEILPDLSLSSQDISFSKLNPNQGEIVYLSAKIHNKGSSSASDVSVKFYDYDFDNPLGEVTIESLLGEVTIESLNANAMEIASIPVSFLSAGSHLIRVVVDPLNIIPELDESDNEASQILQVGVESDITGNILVTGGLPSTVVANSLFKVTGHAAYEIYINGDRNTDYDVKGGTVQITIKGDGDREWIYPGIYTDINGNFAKLLQAPENTGIYHIIMTVTDKTFTGTRNLFFEVIAQSPPTPPSPPTSSGSGLWSCIDDISDTWTWEWTVLPVHEPVFESNLYVHAEDIYFSKDNPALGDEISIIAEIHYWSSSTAIKGTNVPVNFYVTYPGYPKMKIGETVIQSISVGEPDYGSSHVFVSWKNQAEGIYIVEAEIDPSYEEENKIDNAATRAIIVGQLGQSCIGVISGHVTNPLGGVGGVFIALYDSKETFLSDTVTDETGGYLFTDIEIGAKQVKINTPVGHLVDSDTKDTVVECNKISVVDFLIADREGPLTTNVSTDLNPVQIADTINLTAFVDDTETGNSDISSAEYSLDGGVTWIEMEPQDGAFDAPSEQMGWTITAPEIPGVYELCVRGTDSYDNIGPELCMFLVAYDPEGGFVTGGGWIWSPQGAYENDASLEGKANFGFVSKYKKGASVPTGQTEFQFKMADLNFHSSSYEWLVIAGAKAKYKGVGTINGEGEYKFMLTGIDADINMDDSFSEDRFRIRIWQEIDGVEDVVYDNALESDDDEATTVIGGGAIKVHSSK